MTKIKFTGATAIASNHEALTVGAVGLVVRFEFNSAWDGLHKIAVFHCGGVTKDVLDSSFPANICPIPWECLQEEGETLYCGVYGTDSNGNVIIPSKMARLGTVHPAADPTGDESLDPTLPVWQQALNMAQDAMSLLAGKVNRSGDTMQGDLNMGMHTLRLGATTGMTEDNLNIIRLVADREEEGVTLRNIDTPYGDTDAVNKKYVDDKVNALNTDDIHLSAASEHHSADETVTEVLDGLSKAIINIPTALPNPHKLTINGTSYDGTEDVQMTIQGGGGTSDHSQLTNRDAANQHPITAIMGLQTALDGKADAADIPSLEGYATEAYVQSYHDNTKQDIINDLATIRSGAALGATAVQPETGKGLFSGSYNDLTDKPAIPDAVTEGTVSGWGFTKNTGTYSKPTDGIPKSDLAAAVQTSLDKADSALQRVPIGYRTAAAQDAIDRGKVDKVDGKGLSTNDYTDAAKAKVDAIPENPQYTDTVFSGNYNDLTNKPTIPTALPNPNAITFTGAVTGSYNGSEPLSVNIPTAPTKTSQIINDSGFLTSHQDISGKQDKATLEADVAAKGFTKNTGTYSKPAGGIPKADLASAVQTSLGKADTALQEHQSLAAYRTAAAQDVIDNGKVDKVTGKGLSSNDYTDAAKAKVDALALVATSGSYNDLTDKPTIPTIPEYVRSEAETVARIVNQRQSNDSIVFPFLSDAHCGYYTDTGNAATTLAGQLLNQIGKRTPYDFIVHGGDFSTGAWNTTKLDSFEHIEDYTELMSEANKGGPSLWCAGNHDDAAYQATANRVSQKELFGLVGRKNRISGASCPNGCNYGYMDLENRKLRVIYLDTDDKRSWGTVAVGNGATAPAYLNAQNVGGAQLQWLANTGLDFTGKANPAEWDIVVVSHAALNISGTITDAVSGTVYAHSTENATKILNAYRTGKSGSITHNGVTVNYNFTAVGSKATVICAVHGHNHKFGSETLTGGILSIGCPNVMNGRERASDDGNTYTKTAGTANGTSFCILTIDRENCTIYADCVGAGYDREFTYTTEVIAYTNQIPISTDTDGSVYGYKAGYRLNGSGNPEYMNNSYVTGFIPVAVGDTVYMKNVTFQYGVSSGLPSNNQRVSFYNASKTQIVQLNATGLGGNANGVKGDDNIWIQFARKSTMKCVNCSGVAYFRINAAYIGDDSIITVNEPIG